MRTRQAKRLSVVTAVGALALATLGIAGGQAAPGAPNSATFEDAVGEDLEAPDITSVAVANNRMGELTFRISVPNRPVLTEDMRLWLRVDWDDSAATGLTVEGQQGVDTFILVDRGLHGFGAAAIGGCSGNSCSTGVDPDVLRFAYGAGVATFTLDTTRFDVPLKRFRFRVQVQSGVVFDEGPPRRWDLTNVRTDRAPTHSEFPTRSEYWVYDSRPLLVKTFSRAPARPRAGKPFVLRLSASRTDTNAVVRRGAVSCSLKVGGKPLRARSSGFVGQRATCAYSIPASAKGLRYRGTISVRVNGAAVSRSLAGRVR
jgi:hypothetical protein